MPGEDLSALEFKGLSSEDRDWKIFDNLRKGRHTMSAMKRDIDKNKEDIQSVCKALETHCQDKGIHPAYRKVGNPSRTSGGKYVTKRNALIVAALTFGTAVIWLIIEVIN